MCIRDRLDRDRHTSGQAGQDQRAFVQQGRVAFGGVGDRARGRRPALVAVDQEGGEGGQEGERHDVVAALAGLAGGVAISVKLTMLAPIGAILVGMILVSGRGRRWTTTWVTSLAMAVTGTFWYARAAIITGGNPTPQISFGPLNLPTPDQMPIDPRPRFSVADYLFDPAVYRAWFFPN